MTGGGGEEVTSDWTKERKSTRTIKIMMLMFVVTLLKICCALILFGQKSHPSVKGFFPLKWTWWTLAMTSLRHRMRERWYWSICVCTLKHAGAGALTLGGFWGLIPHLASGCSTRRCVTSKRRPEESGSAQCEVASVKEFKYDREACHQLSNWNQRSF